MGIPLVVLPPLNGNGRPERKAALFFKGIPDTYVDGGHGGEESNLLRSFLTCLVDEFDARKRRQLIDVQDLAEIERRISDFTESDVLLQLEKKSTLGTYYFNGFSIKWPDSACVAGASIAASDIQSRFESATPIRVGAVPCGEEVEARKHIENYLANARNAKRHVSSMYHYLLLWRTFSSSRWGRIVCDIIRNWDRMWAGWPDINILHPRGGITVVEVKGRDRIHPSQVYTLLKLRDLLGGDRIAIAWVNQAFYAYRVSAAHHEAVRHWICDKASHDARSWCLPAGLLSPS